MPKGVFKYIIYIFFISLMIILSFQTFTIASPHVTLGSGVNITANTLIKLTGLNCNLTLADDHIVDKLEVHSDYLLMNVSSAPTWIKELTYTYSDNQINITCPNYDTSYNLYLNTTILGNIEIYSVSEHAYITSALWSEGNQNFIFTVEASPGITSETKVHWRDTIGPDTVQCTPTPCDIWFFDSGTQIVTVRKTHSSPVTVTMHAQSESNPPQWSNLYHDPIPPAVITTLDPVTIKVTWEDDTGLGSANIWENSTGEWQGHVVHP